MTIEAGRRLGPYEIVSPIGAGGMGEVYMAQDTRLERTVAIKVLPEHLAAFITDPAVIRTILDHRDKTDAEPRAPPDVSSN